MVQKVRTLMKTNQFKTDPHDEPIQTVLSFALNLAAVLVMGYFTIRHWGDEPSWAQSALMQAGLGGIGLLGTSLLRPRKATIPGQFFKRFEIQTILRGLGLWIIAMLTQFISQAAFTFETQEQALYFIMAAINEESFFRGFFLGMAQRLDPIPPKFMTFPLAPSKQIPVVSVFMWIMIIIQSIGWVLIHQNYYGQISMQIAIFLGGIIFGFFYVLWKDLTANIIAHFILNALVVGSTLVIL